LEKNAAYWRPSTEQLFPKILNILVFGDTAVVELTLTGTTLKGTGTTLEGCWILEFRGEQIEKARCYTDTALMKRVWEEGK
jgi:ketosteroid isomerase-like protein